MDELDLYGLLIKIENKNFLFSFVILICLETCFLIKSFGLKYGAIFSEQIKMGKCAYMRITPFLRTSAY
jgi:hypothetical protein